MELPAALATPLSGGRTDGQAGGNDGRTPRPKKTRGFNFKEWRLCPVLTALLIIHLTSLNPHF